MPALQTLDAVVDVETPEQVVFSYTVAGIGSRAAAALIDYVLSIAAILLIVTAVIALVGTSRTNIGASGPWIVAVMIILLFGMFWGYYVLFEALWDGQTPGKRRLGL